MKKVLIISPHFPPVNAADHQRVRMALPYFKEFGWSPHILCVHADDVDGTKDPLLLKTVPADVPVDYVRVWPLKLTLKFMGRGLSWRSLGSITAHGGRLLKKGGFDLVYFSTTFFLTMCAAPRWLKKYGVPYVLDYQDPWISHYYDDKKSSEIPGGRLKYRFDQWLAGKLESGNVRHAAHITSVSPAYPEEMLQRYRWLDETRFSVLPFGAPEKDFEFLSREAVPQPVYSPRDGKQHWVYVGRAGVYMEFAVRALFHAFAEQVKLNPGKFSNVRIHFLGTHAASGTVRKSVEPLALEYGIQDYVDEQPARLAYFEALQCLRDADALLVPGSDDPTYTASKIYPYILAGKPLLAVFHERSSVTRVIQETKAGIHCSFRSGDTVETLSLKIQRLWFQEEGCRQPSAFLPQLFKPYTAYEMTRKLCRIFDACSKK